MSLAKVRGDRGEAEVAGKNRRKASTIIPRHCPSRYGKNYNLPRDRRGTLLFVEVKLRGEDSIGLPREFVDGRKQQRLRTAAELYLAQNGIEAPARFDVAEVYTDETGKPRRVEYLEDAFQ